MARNSTTAPLESRVTSNVIRGTLGNLIEYFDWFVFASFSVYFAQTFFPEGNLTAQLLSAASIFAVGFLMRPLGGWFLGLFADRFGRKAALSLSVAMMSVGSLMIAVAPPFASVGMLAPILLVVARLIQGLSIGGEFGSSATYLAEVATPGRRGFYSSFQYVSIILGQLCALATMILLQLVLNEEQMYDFGWRIPFAVGALAGLGVLWLRRNMDESAQFEEAKKAREQAAAKGEKAPEATNLRTLLKYRKPLFVVFTLAIGGSVAFYTYTSYMQKYMINTSGISKEHAAIISFAALFVFMCLQPVIGALSDKIGRRPIMLTFSIGTGIITVPVLTFLGTTSNVWVAFGLMTLGLAFVSGYTALSAIIKAEMFPTHIRALGVGLPHAMVTAVFGGTAEPIALALKQVGSENVFFWYITVCVAITLYAAIVIKEPSRNSKMDGVLATGENAVPTAPAPADGSTGQHLVDRR